MFSVAFFRIHVLLPSLNPAAHLVVVQNLTVSGHKISSALIFARNLGS